MAVFLDTGVLVAAYNAQDTERSRAQGILQRIFQGEWGSAYTSENVIDEAVTLLFARSKNRTLAQSFLKKCLESQSLFEILGVGGEDFANTADEFLKQKELSFTDCSILALMRKHGIRNLATFDAGFRQAKDIHTISQ
ncbi:type II toxin-antitoxin system VapC family toxin [Candidatus Micrarchaeota archaeon]|nr:type II toxin-antitoxin system VapC family toxin [Candidatus Micrarchaeota archaeon]